ncbi:hypothetical protein J7L68_03095, partial [bacterium]|nr:hypothetical protein [bacterium]
MLDTTFYGQLAFQNAIDRANDSSDIDSIYYVYNGNYDAGDYCYYNTTFDSSAAYSVAMGDSCLTNGNDEYNCSSTEFFKSNDNLSTRGFDTSTANICINDTISNIEYSGLDNWSPYKLLAYYYDDPFHPYLLYIENVGYDTLITRFLGKRNIRENCISKQQFSISAYPNPFNSSISITVSDGRGLARQTPTNIAIYDLRGNVVWEQSPDRDNRHREMSPTSRAFIWQPDKS